MTTIVDTASRERGVSLRGHVDVLVEKRTGLGGTERIGRVERGDAERVGVAHQILEQHA